MDFKKQSWCCVLAVCMSILACKKKSTESIEVSKLPAPMAEVITLDFFDKDADATILFDSATDAKSWLEEMLPWMTVVFEVADEITLKSKLEEAIALPLWSPGSDYQAFLDSPLLVTVKNNGLTFSLRAPAPKLVQEWHQRFREKHVARHPDALGIDEFKTSTRDVHLIMGEAYDYTWMISEGWLHIRMGGSETFDAWVASFDKKETTPNKSFALESLLKGKDLSLHLTGKGAKLLSDDDCQRRLVSKIEHAHIAGVRKNETWIVDGEVNLLDDEASAMSLTAFAPVGFESEELLAQSNLFMESNGDIENWLHHLPCLKSSGWGKYLPEAFAVGVQEWNPQVANKNVAAMVVEGANRPLAREIAKIPLRKLFERNLKVGSEDWKRLSIPTQPTLFYTLDEQTLMKAALTEAMTEPVAGTSVIRKGLHVRLNVKPHGFVNLESTFGELNRLLGLTGHETAAKAAKVLMAFRQIDLRLSSEAERRLSFKLTWESS